MFAHVSTHFRPDRKEHALAFVVACSVLVGLAEVAGLDRAVHGAYDLAQSDVGRRTGQYIAPTYPSLRADQAGSFER